MIMLFLMIISPEPGNFRTKIESIEDKIKAYELLEKKILANQTSSQTSSNALPVSVKKENKLKKIQINQKTIYKTKPIKLINAVKSKQKFELYWDNELQVRIS